MSKAKKAAETKIELVKRKWNIIVKNLCKTYDRNQVLDHFSCTFREKKMTCIMGKSGIGKSTLLSILMGLEKADEGTVSGMEHQKISVIISGKPPV